MEKVEKFLVWPMLVVWLLSAMSAHDLYQSNSLFMQGVGICLMLLVSGTMMLTLILIDKLQNKRDELQKRVDMLEHELKQARHEVQGADRTVNVLASVMTQTKSSPYKN